MCTFSANDAFDKVTNPMISNTKWGNIYLNVTVEKKQRILSFPETQPPAGIMIETSPLWKRGENVPSDSFRLS